MDETGSVAVGEGAAYLGRPPHELMTEEECVRHGGHCFTRTGFSHATITPEFEEACKHCGKRRWAIPRHPFDYRDA